MAENAPGRSTSRRGARGLIAGAAVVGALGLGFVPTATAQDIPTAAPTVDVERFSERAAAWAAANQVHRDAATERAIALGEEAAEAEAEAERQAAALAAAAATTTTAAPTTTTTTTVAPTTTTTAAPTTTVAPADPDDSGDDGDGGDEPTTTTEAPTTTTTAAPGGPTAEQWAALRNCESGGRYDALSPGGRYRGAYQFSQATWDWVASFANPALVGVDPAAASVADQDAQAQALYDRQGAGPWPHCGRHLS